MKNMIAVFWSLPKFRNVYGIFLNVVYLITTFSDNWFLNSIVLKLKCIIKSTKTTETFWWSNPTWELDQKCEIWTAIFYVANSNIVNIIFSFFKSSSQEKYYLLFQQLFFPPFISHGLSPSTTVTPHTFQHYLKFSAFFTQNSQFQYTSRFLPFLPFPLIYLIVITLIVKIVINLII